MSVTVLNNADVKVLHAHGVFLRTLPQFVYSFKASLNAVPLTESGSFSVPDLQITFALAYKHARRWDAALKDLPELLHDLEGSGNGVIQDAQLMLAGTGDRAGLLKRTFEQSAELLDRLEKYQERLEYLIKGVYSVTPRVFDFIRVDVRRHARAQGLTTTQLEDARHYEHMARRDYVHAYIAASEVADQLARWETLMSDTMNYAYWATRQENNWSVFELRMLSVTQKELLRLLRLFNHTAEID